MSFKERIDEMVLDLLEGKKVAVEDEGEKVECPKCEGEGCDHCDDTGYHMAEAKLDAVGKEDDDVDNDGDVDDSDKYLKKRRAAISKAVKKEDKKQFMYAAKMAKEKGDAKFMFAGKEYKVEDADLVESIITKGSIKSKDSWKKAHAALQKMEKQFKGTKKEKDYYEVLNALYHTVDDWDDMDDEDRAPYSKKTATDRTYGDDPIADLRFDLKKLLGSDSSKILEDMEVDESSCGTVSASKIKKMGKEIRASKKY